MKAEWHKTTLGAVAQVGAGNSAPQGDAHFAEGIYPFFRTSDAGRVRFGDIAESSDYLNDEAVKGLRLLPAGTILFPKSGASTFLNHRVMMAVDGYVSSHLATIVGDESKVDRRFLLYFLSTVSAQDLVQDHAYPSLNLQLISGIPVLLPPLSEQHRIVAILDEAFAKIATAKANAEKNLQNARHLFESHLNKVFTERGEGWVETTLGAEIDLLVGFAFKSAKYSANETDVPLLRGDNIVQGSLRWDDVKRWPQNDTFAYDRYWLRENDIVLAMDRPWVKSGLKHAVITSDDLPCLLVQRTASLRCKRNLDSQFLMYLVRTGAFIRHILGVQTGIGVPHVSGQQIKDFIFARPNVDDQVRIAANLNGLLRETQRLESIYRQKLTALDELKQSLLHQAFSGAL